MNYYIADMHFGHANILKLSHRPFKNIDEMDEYIIKKWNEKVTKDDDVYILGDFAFRSEDPMNYIKRLNGKLHLITGNHDKKVINNYRRCFVEITQMKTVRDTDKNGNEISIVLCHYPLVEWDGYYRGFYHFYGHVHNTFNNATTQYAMNMDRAYNVGVDIINFEPCTFDEVIERNTAINLKR